MKNILKQSTIIQIRKRMIFIIQKILNNSFQFNKRRCHNAKLCNF